MSGDETGGERSRESGIELGDLSQELDEHSYPTSADELVDEYGDREIQMPNGSETFEQVLGPMGEESFDSADSVRQAIFNMVGAEAVGRKGYTDREPTHEEGSDESF